MKFTWDIALVTAFGAMKREKVSPLTFWKLYKSISGLVLDAGLVEKLLQIETEWGEVADTLIQVASSTRIGLRMFGFALEKVLVEKLSKFIDEKISMLNGCHLDSTALQEWVSQTLQECNALPGISFLPMKRLVPISYRGISINKECTSINQEVQLKAPVHSNTHYGHTRFSDS
eukprot:2719504-Lingulodinium_polyedra.AAC.1